MSRRSHDGAAGAIPVLTSDFRPSPYWLDEAPLIPANDPLPERVDVAVIGSGYCGLSAARVLARAGVSTLVLDAGDPGAGASTRNHGHIGGGGKLPPKLDAQVGTERATLIRRDAVESVAFVRALIRDERLDVDYVQRGRFIAAHSPGAFAGLQRRAEAFRTGLGLTVGIIPRERQREEIGSDFYYGGITVAEAGALQPAKLHGAMRRLAEDAGAQVRGQARVQSIGREGSGFRLETARGVVHADKVVVATNAYSGAVTPYIQRRIVPVTAFMIATEPMPEELAQEALPRNRTGGDTKRALYAFRRSPDGRRIVFAGRAKFHDIDERRAAAILHRFMCGVWPQLAGVRVSHCWKGFVGFTFDHLPHMGEHEGLHYAAGCQGAGVAMMSYLGDQIGLKILGRQARPCGLDTAQFPTLPTYRGRPWFLPIVGGYYTLRDRLDRALARRA
ncbi:MAG: FAD-binding oxidoreductase [Acidisphaera sp.]|nr:FAD-binding oxidoreductase [Acidisphaera sp.]